MADSPSSVTAARRPSGLRRLLSGVGRGLSAVGRGATAAAPYIGPLAARISYGLGDPRGMQLEELGRRRGLEEEELERQKGFDILRKRQFEEEQAERAERRGRETELFALQKPFYQRQLARPEAPVPGTPEYIQALETELGARAKFREPEKPQKVVGPGGRVSFVAPETGRATEGFFERVPPAIPTPQFGGPELPPTQLPPTREPLIEQPRADLSLSEIELQAKAMAGDPAAKAVLAEREKVFREREKFRAALRPRRKGREPGELSPNEAQQRIQDIHRETDARRKSSGDPLRKLSLEDARKKVAEERRADLEDLRRIAAGKAAARQERKSESQRPRGSIRPLPGGGFEYVP